MTDPENTDSLPKNYITPSGYTKLRRELSSLVKKERPDVVSVVSWAASNGDRSENGDYIYGKKRLREIDRRIHFLTKRLEAAEVIDPSTQQNLERVFFGATVTVENLTLDKKLTLKIVGVDELDSFNNCISWVSPVAKALMKSSVGDVVEVHTPEGVEELEVVEIKYI